MGGEGRGGGRPGKGGRMEKRTYRRGLQAVQRRGELVTEFLQDHGYSISAAVGRMSVLCPACAWRLLLPHVASYPGARLLWPCVLWGGNPPPRMQQRRGNGVNELVLVVLVLIVVSYLCVCQGKTRVRA